MYENQLARWVNTSLTEAQLVGIIAGLTRDKFRVHIRLQRPVTDFRRIAGVPDLAISTTNRTMKSEITAGKKSDSTTMAGNATTNHTFNTQQKPSSVCIYDGATTSTVNFHTNLTFRETTEDSAGSSQPSSTKICNTHGNIINGRCLRKFHP